MRRLPTVGPRLVVNQLSNDRVRVEVARDVVVWNREGEGGIVRVDGRRRGRVELDGAEEVLPVAQGKVEGVWVDVGFVGAILLVGQGDLLRYAEDDEGVSLEWAAGVVTNRGAITCPSVAFVCSRLKKPKRAASEQRAGAAVAEAAKAAMVTRRAAVYFMLAVRVRDAV